MFWGYHNVIKSFHSYTQWSWLSLFYFGLEAIWAHGNFFLPINWQMIWWVTVQSEKWYSHISKLAAAHSCCLWHPLIASVIILLYLLDTMKLFMENLPLFLILRINYSTVRHNLFLGSSFQWLSGSVKMSKY